MAFSEPRAKALLASMIPGVFGVRRSGIANLEILQPHLTPGDDPVVVVGDGDQPQLLAAAPVDGLDHAVHRARADGTQEVGVVVDPTTFPPPRVASQV